MSWKGKGKAGKEMLPYVTINKSHVNNIICNQRCNRAMNFNCQNMSSSINDYYSLVVLIQDVFHRSIYDLRNWFFSI